MMPNPKPDEVISFLNGYCPVAKPDSRLPKAADFLEMQRWMARILFE
jgi:hypothetical protein